MFWGSKEAYRYFDSVLRIFEMNDKLVSFVNECIDAMLDGNPGRFSPGVVRGNQLSKRVTYCLMENKDKFFSIAYAANDSDYKGNEIMVEVGDLKDIINSKVKRFFIDGGPEQVVNFIENGLK